MTKWLAAKLRTIADRIDRPGAPKATGMSYEFVRGVGVEVNWNGHGCPLWYLSDADHDRAYERGRL